MKRFNKSARKKNFLKDILNQLKNKNGLMKKLFITFTCVILCSMIILSYFTYFITKEKITEDFKNSANQILNQNKNYVHMITDNISNISMQICNNREIMNILSKDTTDTYKKIENHDKISNYVSSIMVSGVSDIVKSIYVFSDNGYNISTDGKNIYDKENYSNFIQSDIYKNTIKLNGKALWSSTYKNFFDEDEEIVSLTRILVSPNSFKKCGVLQVNISPTVLKKALDLTK